MTGKKIPLDWKVHTPNLFKEIVEGGEDNCNAIFRAPLSILLQVLGEVAHRAKELNDPQLTAIMVRLTLYTMADPEHKDYDPKLVKKILNEGRRK